MMSVFPEYSPKTLWTCTVRLVHTLFHTPPMLTRQPKSYFHATLEAHRAILSDLTGILADVPEAASNETTTIRYIHESLSQIEVLLFEANPNNEIPKTLEGACIRTSILEKRLRTSRRMCVVI